MDEIAHQPPKWPPPWPESSRELQGVLKLVEHNRHQNIDQMQHQNEDGYQIAHALVHFTSTGAIILVFIQSVCEQGVSVFCYKATDV